MHDISNPDDKNPQKLQRIQHQKNNLLKTYQRLRFMDRKAETHRKIQLGGLIIKAGLAEETTAVILGLLLEAREQLMRHDNDSIRSHFRIKGDLALTKDKICTRD